MTKSTSFEVVSMLALSLALSLAMALAVGPAHADSKADAAQELARATQLDSQGDHKGACKAYRRASDAAQGQSAAAWIGLASCYDAFKEVDQTITALRQALTVASNPEERAKANQMLGYALLRESGERGAAEALSLFKDQVAGSGGAQGQRGVLTALLVLHRDQEAAEILADLRKQGKSEADLQQGVLLGIGYPGPLDAKEQIGDFKERLHRLDPETPLRVDDGITRPEIVHQVKPETTEEARQHQGFSGTVILETVIDKDGRVGDVRLLKGQPYGLSEKAIDAVKQWTFKPATLDGKPVKVYYVLTVNFKIGPLHPSPWPNQ
jgi:TonB family protein